MEKTNGHRNSVAGTLEEYPLAQGSFEVRTIGEMLHNWAAWGPLWGKHEHAMLEHNLGVSTLKLRNADETRPKAFQVVADDERHEAIKPLAHTNGSGSTTNIYIYIQIVRYIESNQKTNMVLEVPGKV